MNRIETICIVLGSVVVCSCAGSYPESTAEHELPADDSIDEDRFLVAEHSQSIHDLEEQLRQPAYAQQTVEPPPEPVIENPIGPSTPNVPFSPDSPSDDRSPEPSSGDVEDGEPSVGLEESYSQEVYGYEIMCGDNACVLRDQICDLSLRICMIAERHPDTEDMEWQCEDAMDRCQRADDEVIAICGCEQWEPTFMGNIMLPSWNMMSSFEPIRDDRASTVGRSVLSG